MELASLSTIESEGKPMKMEQWVNDAISFLTGLKLDAHGDRDVSIPGDIKRYRKSELTGYLGYDQWAGWLIIVEWGWMKVLHELGVMPDEDAALLTDELLYRMLAEISTTWQDKIERSGGGHDILALLALMDRYLPEALRRWRHFAATSYDPICTAYALQYKSCFMGVVYPKMLAVDELWRQRIKETAAILQMGRTHLISALPVTVGFWLAGLHNRYVRNCSQAYRAAEKVEAKFSGAVGTHAAQMALIGKADGEQMLMNMLGLERAEISTQIAPPESLEDCYHALTRVSFVLGNLGEDARLLQAAFRELDSVSSTSSTMSHKRHNPVAAEQLFGMHRTMASRYNEVILNMISDLQRDLSNSSPMRNFVGMIAIVYQQLCTAERWLEKLRIHEDVCQDNFQRDGKLLTAELLHLSLQRLDFPEAHKFVNTEIVPMACTFGFDLVEAVDGWIESSYVGGQARVQQANALAPIWAAVPDRIKELLKNPASYIGRAEILAEQEASNQL